MQDYFNKTSASSEKSGYIKNAETNQYVLFLTSEFSQWYPCEFTSKEGQKFNCAEQFMMYQKAFLFGDFETADRIVKAETAKEQKELGRQVRDFDAEIWDAHAQEIVYQGNYYKFTQNPHLFDVLVATGSKTIVEAADYDKVWGIGLRADDPLAQDKAMWKGDNWLGGALTKLRDDLRAANFAPTCNEDNSPMFKFYDEEGQRMLYISGKELARQEGKTTIEELVADFDYINFLNTTGYQPSSYDNPDHAKTVPFFSAQIKGANTWQDKVYNPQKEFMLRNQGVMQKYRKPSKNAFDNDPFSPSW